MTDPIPLRCEAVTKAGEPCRSRAINGSGFCFYHDPVTSQESFSRGGQIGGARRSVRERFREDAERHYELLIKSLLEALDSEVTRWGDCPHCKHKVPVTFPDIRARTQAIQTLVDQGYGRPLEAVRVETADPLDEMSIEELKALVACDRDAG
jgi:hypothetical protein